jgi:desulfoferrodoxin-like iron-binding protein
MAEKLEVYKCEKCGNIVQVLHGEESTGSETITVNKQEN